MITPEYLEGAAAQIESLYSDLQDSIIRDIVFRLLKTDFTVAGTTAWRMERLQMAGMTYEMALELLSSTTKKAVKELNNLFRDAGVQVFDYGEEVYSGLGINPLSVKQSPAMRKVLEAGARRTRNTMRNLTQTTAGMVQNTFISAVDRAEMAVVSGAFSYNEAITAAIAQASAEGAWVRYPTGHRDRIDVAVRRCVQSGLGGTVGALNEMACDELDCDLVEVTAHWNARPSHAEWQGLVYSRSGKNKNYPDFSVCGYGTGAGLLGWNCYHDFHPFFEGLSERLYNDGELREMKENTVTYQGKTMSGYEATQYQRGLEREIRASKRELLGLDEGRKNAAGELLRELDDAYTKTAERLSKQNARLEDFCRQTGFQKEYERSRVQGFGKSQAQKAVQAGKRGLTKDSGRGIINNIKPKQEVQDVHYVGKIDREIYKCVAKDIQTDEVIITDKQIQHIIERRGQAFYDKYSGDFSEIISDPDYIFKDDMDNTAIACRHYDVDGISVNVILRLIVKSENTNYKNSIITVIGENDKRFKQRLRNSKAIYKKA